MDYNYAVKAGSNSGNTEQGNAIYNDGTYSYVTGKFAGTATFGSCGNFASSGGNDIFVAVYNSSGTCVDVEIRGGAGDDEGLGITSFSTGGTRYVYVCGYSGSDIYFIKYTASAGALTYSSDHTVTSSGADGKARGITNDGTNIYAIGYFNTSADFGSGTTRFKQDNCSSSSGTGKDMFVVKYGTGSWSETAFGQIGDSNNDDNEGYAITYASSPAARLYVTGYFKGTVKFVCPSGGTLTASGSRDIFVSSLTTGCVFNNDQYKGGGSSTETGGHSNTWDIGYGITSFYASSSSNGIAITGNIHNASCSFGTNTINGASNSPCAFFAKYPINSSTGNIGGDASWAYSTGYTSGSETYSQGRCASNDGYHFIFGGIARSYVRFSGASSTQIDLNGLGGGGDIGFIAKFDRDGKVVWADEIDQNPSSSGAACYGIFTSSCTQFITGVINGACDFGTAPTTVTSTGASDIFTASVKKDNYVIKMCGPFSLAFTINCDVTDASSYSWSPGTNLSSTTVYNPTLTLANCSSTAGTITYTCTTTGGTCPGARTIIVKTSQGVTASSADAGADKGSCCTVNWSGSIAGTGCNGWTYSWSPGTFLSSTTVINPTVTNCTVTTTYTLTTTDACGTTDTDVMNVNISTSCCRISDSTAFTKPASVFPNPSNGTFTISPGEELTGPYTIIVSDLMGNIVYSKDNVSNKKLTDIYLNDQPKGVYLLSMLSGETKIVYRLVLQ